MIFFFIAMAVIVGCLMPVQASLNTELTRLIKSPYLAAAISFSTGSLALIILYFIQGNPSIEFKRLTSVPPALFLGGILGAIFVSSTIFFIPRLGATTMIAAFIAGQLLMSLFLDHYGLLGLTPNPLTITRLLGVLFLFFGVFLVVKKV